VIDMWKQEPNFNMATWVKLRRVSKAWEVATKETITEIEVWMEEQAEVPMQAWLDRIDQQEVNRMTEMMYYSPPQDSDESRLKEKTKCRDRETKEE